MNIKEKIKEAANKIKGDENMDNDQIDELVKDIKKVGEDIITLGKYATIKTRNDIRTQAAYMDMKMNMYKNKRK